MSNRPLEEKENTADSSAIKPSNRKNREIAILPYENYDISQFRDSLEAAALTYRLEPNFAVDVYVTSDLSDAERQRKQRDAVRVIYAAKDVLKETDENPRYALVVSKPDIFVGKTNFVFGVANHELGVGLISTARLVEWTEGVTPSLIKERILKEASHEIGHLGGLAHCERKECLMSFSNNIEEVDQKLPILCDGCKKKMRTNGR